MKQSQANLKKVFCSLFNNYNTFDQDVIVDKNTLNDTNRYYANVRSKLDKHVWITEAVQDDGKLSDGGSE